jgi:hypothetical protein
MHWKDYDNIEEVEKNDKDEKSIKKFISECYEKKKYQQNEKEVDIWAAGVVLFAKIYGQLPFTGTQ